MFRLFDSESFDVEKSNDAFWISLAFRVIGEAKCECSRLLVYILQRPKLRGHIVVCSERTHLVTCLNCEAMSTYDWFQETHYLLAYMSLLLASLCRFYYYGHVSMVLGFHKHRLSVKEQFFFFC